MLAELTKTAESRKSPPAISKSPSTNLERANSDNGHSTADEEDDEEIFAAPRRRLARLIERSTPEPQDDADESLFVSPSPHKSAAADRDAAGSDSDDNDLPMDLSKNARFQALVEKKRKERLTREAEEERKQEARAQRMPADDDSDDVSDISDDEGGRKLTQDVSRPARKASKKALEEMNRETQRLSRSLQLAHEAKTKKKISKASLFERFNFRSGATSTKTQPKLTSSSRSTTPGSAHQTDAEATPPSSPPSVSKSVLQQPAPTTATVEAPALNEDKIENLGDSDDVFADMKRLNKGKEKDDVSIPAPAEAGSKTAETKKPRRQVRVKLTPAQVNMVTIDSDDELEITEEKKGRLDAVFARVPEHRVQESTQMKILHNLAHLSSPGKETTRGRNVKPSMTTSELHMSLQQRAKLQAKLERERRLDALRAKGVVIQSAEEREKEREQVEDIVARARQEVEEIMQREREDAKKARKEKKQNGEADALDWDDSDDESFQGSEEDEPEEMELSGSEDDEADGNTAEDGDEEAATSNMLLDEADEGQSDDERPLSEDEVEEDTESLKPSTALKSRQQRKRVQIISDDEEDDAEDEAIKATPRPKNFFPKSPSAPGSGSPKAPTSVLRSATKSFIPGFPIAAAAPAGLGLTQIFAGTMDDSQAAPGSGSPVEFMPSFDQFPDSQFSATAGESQNIDSVLDSQPAAGAESQEHESQTQRVQLYFSQSQAHGFDSLLQEDATQMSECLEPTQDGGFQDYTPLKQRFVDSPHSTIDTLPYIGTPGGDSVQDSPLVRKKGKLISGADRAVSIATLPPTEIPASPGLVPDSTVQGTADENAISSDAFRLMQRAAKRAKRLKKKFDKKRSEANGMIEEQAEESEDEYAGLGGADGEDSSDEDDELVKEMIDDTGNHEGDEAKIAGLFADRARAEDAAQVDKLFRDITTGMLRKKRRAGGDGHDFDLSDSDDGGEARRRMKRRQFAKMQKALFADERIEKIAENPRNAAFLKSIEDRNSDDEWDFGDNFAADATSTSGDDSQPQAQASQGEEAIPDSQPPATGRKRSRMDDHTSRSDSKLRRTHDGARPASIAEVRRSLSSLLEEPNGSVGSVIPATYDGSDEEDGGERPSTANSNKENHRPTKQHRGSAAVVDRITLKRNSSSTISASSRLAFAANQSSASSGGFKVPALLRRATTNSLISNSSTSSAVAPPIMSTTSLNGSAGGSLNTAGSFSEEGKGVLKKNAGKRSGINYFAHENERRAKVADAEKRREAKKWKGAEGRGKVVGGLFGSGSFE
ncbi:hypothetical protein F5Y16DRAFT_359242 [Xylariaceae sp. FL0255]|nr:hypothetical protein F5Y16DRAFT_359242 [Xylariaceae sp. FL0255]